MRELTWKQKLFVEAYLGKANGNATEAARVAGYRWPDKQGAQLLAKPQVKAAVGARLDDAAMSTDEILGRLSDIARGSLEDFIKVDAQGNYRIDLAGARKGNKLHLLRKLKRGEHGVELELHDPLKALDKLARYRKLYSDEPQVNLAITVDLLARAEAKHAERRERRGAAG